MMNTIMQVLLLLATLGIFLPANAKGYYTAAVFEHRPRATADKTVEENIAINLKYYEKAAIVAASKGTDIIVFNEYGLVNYDERGAMLKYAEFVPDPKKGVFNPCLSKGAADRPMLRTLSCLARENRMYVVANMLDVQPCVDQCDADKVDACHSRCPPDDVFLYNTDIAFDREGNLIARYHKVHPYFEVVDVPDGPEMVSFSTEMGTFGLIICFDSVFVESLKLARDHRIDAMIFPTFWFDDIVPFNGVEWQQSWALANGVDFIAANTHTPGTGSVGSGIYSRRDGALVYTFEPDGESKLLVANVRTGKSEADVPNESSITVITEYGARPKVKETGDKFDTQCFETDSSKANYHLNERGNDVYEEYNCFTSQTEGYSKVKLQDPAGHAEACHDGFCCSVTYSVDDLKEDFYLVVFNGTNNVDKFYYWWEEVCMVVRCDSYEGKECFLQPSRSETAFRSVKLKARFSTQTIYPTVSKNKYRLAPKSEFSVAKEGSETTLNFKSGSADPLLKVGLFGRCYDRDPAFVPYYKY